MRTWPSPSARRPGYHTAPMPDPAPLLQMRGICKRFPGVVALDRVDLDVRTGEVLVLMGENGAGKSTLMKVLAGAERPDAGDVVVDGRPVSLASPRVARRLGISVIHQELTLVPHLSVAENVFLGRAPRRAPGLVDWRRMRALADSLLRGLGTTLDVRAPVSRLGIAHQQMVEVARALSDEARVLVMDEPTSALSAAEVDQLFAAIERLVARGVAVVYISHRMDEVFRIGHRVSVLRDGRHVATRAIGETSPAELVKLMADREIAEQYPVRRGRPGSPLLEVRHLARRGVLHDVSFTLHRGEILGVAGLVGAGRTELARAIAGADPVEAGEVVVEGRVVRCRSPREAIAGGVALLPEDRKQQGLVLGMSVQANITLPTLAAFARCGLVKRRAETSEAQRQIAGLRVRTPSPHTPAGSLSGGNQQKVVLAKWLLSHARVLLFDEPTRGIDVAARRDIYDLMVALVAGGAGILMISSDLPEVLGMSDRVLVMRGGRVQAVFDAGRTDAQVLQAALGIAS